MPERRIATVLMLDVVGSTHIAAQLGDARYRELSSRFARSVRTGLRRFGGREEDNAGDGFFVTFPQPDRAIRFATTLADEVRGLGIEIRSGIHTGQTESQDRKTQGMAVVIGSRVMSLAGPGEILVTNTTKELVVGSDFGFEDFSAHELKGVPGTWQVFAVTSIDGEARTQPLPADEAAKRLGAIRPGTVRERRRRPVLAAGALAGLLAIVAVTYVVTREDPSRPVPTDEPVPPSEAIVQVDPEREPPILKSIAVPVPRINVPGVAVPTSSHSMVVGQGSVWTVRFRILFQVDPSRSEVRERLSLESGISFSVNLAEGSDKIWIAYDGGLDEVNPATGEQREAVRSATGQAVSNDVAFGGGFVWLGSSEGRLVRFDPQTNRKVERDGLDPIDAIAFGHGAVWTVDTVGGTVRAYDPDTMRPRAPIAVRGTDSLVAGEEGIWILDRSLGVLTRIDPSTGEVAGDAPVGPNPTGLTAGGGAIWVGDEDGIIRRVDEATRVVTDIPFGAEIRALAWDDETDTLWVDVL